MGIIKQLKFDGDNKTTQNEYTFTAIKMNKGFIYYDTHIRNGLLNSCEVLDFRSDFTGHQNSATN